MRFAGRNDVNRRMLVVVMVAPNGKVTVSESVLTSSRNLEICRRLLLGEHATDLAKEYYLSRSGISMIYARFCTRMGWAGFRGNRGRVTLAARRRGII